MRFLIIFFSYLIFAAQTLYGQFDIGQIKGNEKKIFIEAESYFLYGDYPEALYLYQLLTREFELNRKFSYRIGQCLLNMPGNEQKAIEPLKSSVAAINLNCNESDFFDNCVPYDVYFYLGEAYRMTNEFDKAIESYKLLLENVKEGEYDISRIKHHINSCENAKNAIKTPINATFEPLSKNINTADINRNAVFSSDENIIVYTSSQRFYDAIMYSKKNENGKWSTPINILSQLGVDNFMYPTGLSADGTELYLNGTENYGGDIYYSKYKDGKWLPVSKLNKNINSKYWESHASISKDGNTLYFTSNREGGFGNLDIYKSTKDSKGQWGPAENLGSKVNSEFNEFSPIMIDDKLYFASEGHSTIGGFDIFISTFDGSTFSSPKNLGYPINTSYDEEFYFPSINGNYGFISIRRIDSPNKKDLNKVSLP